MDYSCISADCHIDLCWLPHDLFVANASAALKERMPYVIQGPQGPEWVTKSGLNLGFANGKGAGAGSTGRRKVVPGADRRLDRMAQTGLFSDGSQGIFRPTTPELRLKEQDRDGIQAEVMYGLLNAGNKMTDRDAAIELYRIYNDWLSDFCSYNLQRFVGLASIPSHTPEVAAAEMRRAASKPGIGGFDVSASWDMTPLTDPYWDPMWKAAADMGKPVHFHTINPPPGIPARAGLAEPYKKAQEATWMSGFQLYLATLLSSVIHGGALERYPALRVVLGESGIGWIPYVLDRMDYEYEDKYKGQIPLKMKPSEYWRRQCRATFQNDRVGTKLLDDMGVETVMWGSDYPHADGVFPDSQEYISRQFSHLPHEVKRKVTCENTGRFYGLIRN